MLDRRGQYGVVHRCFDLPFDEKLRKKKKYREAKKRRKEGRTEEEYKLEDMLPIFTEGFSHEDPLLKNSYRTMCRIGKAPWRDPEHDAKLR